MKRTYLTRRSNAIFSPESFSWGVAALMFVLIVFLVRFFAPNFFWNLFAPLYRGADSVAAAGHGFVSSFGDAATLSSKNELLASENAALASENRALLVKVSSLSALLSSTTSGKTAVSGILASVIVRPPESPYDTLVLSEGIDAGVTVGMEVFGAGGVPIGAISSVLPEYSRVTLFSAPGMVTHGWVGYAHVPLTIEGAGGGAMSATLARSANVAVGDVVYVPGPGALPIGSVTRIDDDPAAPEVVLRIIPAVNLFSVTWVMLRDTGVGLLGKSSATSTSP
ncbi:MAG: rod shape-determining protein MreC [bacterium]|nr:rod shape-determining protein MreC [bacterium]